MPDLSPTGVTIYWHPNKQAFDFAALIHNAGEPVSGPFNITLGVYYVSEYVGILGSTDVDPQFSTSQVTVTVPAGVTLNVGETYRSSYSVGIPFVAMPSEDYNYATFTVILADADGQTLATFDEPPAPPVPLPPPGYAPPPVQYWWKLKPHFTVSRPPEGPVSGRLTMHP